MFIASFIAKHPLVTLFNRRYFSNTNNRKKCWWLFVVNLQFQLSNQRAISANCAAFSDCMSGYNLWCMHVTYGHKTCFFVHSVCWFRYNELKAIKNRQIKWVECDKCCVAIVNDCERVREKKRGKMLECKCTCIKKSNDIYIHIFFDELVSAFFQFCVCMMSESIKSAHTKHFGAHSDYVVLHEKIPIQKKRKRTECDDRLKKNVYACDCVSVPKYRSSKNDSMNFIWHVAFRSHT